MSSAWERVGLGMTWRWAMQGSVGVRWARAAGQSYGRQVTPFDVLVISMIPVVLIVFV